MLLKAACALLSEQGRVLFISRSADPRPPPRRGLAPSTENKTSVRYTRYNRFNCGPQLGQTWRAPVLYACTFAESHTITRTSDVTWHKRSQQQHHVKLINILKEGCPWSRDCKGGAINGELQGTRKASNIVFVEWTLLVLLALRLCIAHTIHETLWNAP